MFDSIFKKYNQINIPKQKFYKEAIKLFVNQSFNGTPIAHIIDQAQSVNLHFELEYSVNIRLSENSLYITISFYTNQVKKLANGFSAVIGIIDVEKGAILNGKATYKIEINPPGNKGWIATYGLVNSTIECKDKYKKIFDTRIILQKFIDFFTLLIKKIIANANSNSSLNSNSTIKTNPLVFISRDGSSLDEQIINPPKDYLSRYHF